MSSIISMITANSSVILGVLFAVSEALAVIPGVKSNSIFQLVFGWLSKAEGK